MKKKVLLFSIFLISILFIGIERVNAFNFNSYKKGDKIEVRLNKDTRLNFYVIKDSTSEDTKVTAIYEGVLGDMFWFNPTQNSIEGSTAETKLKELTKDWRSPSKIRLPKADEIKAGINTSQKETFEFSEPSYYHIGKSYWTETVISDNGNYYPYLVTNWGSFSNLHTTLDNAPASGGHIRPVIEITKIFVKDGILDKPKNIEELVLDFEDYLCKFVFPGESVTIKVSYKGDSISVKYTDDSKKNYEAIYKYQDGKISSVINEDPSGFSTGMAFVLSSYFWYLNNDIYFDLLDFYEGKINSVENEHLTISVDESDELKAFSVDLDYYLGFNKNIQTDNTITNNTKTDNATTNNSNVNNTVVKNPKTSDLNIMLIIGASLLFLIGSVVSIKKLKKINKNIYKI